MKLKMKLKMNLIIKSTIILIFVQFIYGCAGNTNKIDYSPIDYVDPFIGVLDGGKSNCVIGPQLPNGSVNPSPQTIEGHHDGYSPDQPIRGFGQLHATGTGWGKYGMLFISPQVGLNIDTDGHDSPKSKEFATAYEYGVVLDRYNLGVKVTPSYHSAIYELTYPESDSASIIFDVTHNIPMHIAPMIGGSVSEAVINIDPNGMIYGHGRYTGGFGDGHYRVYFVAETSKKPTDYGTWNNDGITFGSNKSTLEVENEPIGAFFRFNTSDQEIVHLKIAISFKSVEKAKEWLSIEIPEWDYDSVRQYAIDVWNDQLSKVQIFTDNIDERKIFYTALYQSMRMPRDRTDDLPGFEKDEEVWDDHYAVWDTWRTVFPLMVLLNPDKASSNVKAFINRYKRNGRVKDTYIAGIDMAADQGGDNVDNIISDAFVKGIQGVNWNEAYLVMKHNADNQRLGNQGFGYFGIRDSSMALYKKQGWIPEGVMSTSMSLEYAYNDYCVAQVAKGLGKNEDFHYYANRSKKWINLWDDNAKSDTFKGFITSLDLNGNPVEIDVEKSMGSWKDFFYEGSSWTYSFFVPHQPYKLIELSGGKDMFAAKLDHGLKNGYIDYTNEPAFLAAHLFHYANRPDLASFWVHQLMDNKYSLKGYPGNEDSGAMGSWYVFAAMGFFPNAGQNIYFLHGPRYRKVEIKLNNTNVTITADNVSEENIYVQSCTLNGKPWNQSWITHNELIEGAKLHFVMGAHSSDWGTNNHIPTLDSLFDSEF